jgi:hypothetical protein
MKQTSGQATKKYKMQNKNASNESTYGKNEYFSSIIPIALKLKPKKIYYPKKEDINLFIVVRPGFVEVRQSNL